MEEHKGQYGNFAYYYDMLMDDMDYDGWSDYIKSIVDMHGVMYKDILEMACGTGNMAVRMAKKGYNVTAFDISEDMLSVAYNKAKDGGADLRLLCQDMRNIDLNDEFGIILCLCDSINYITDEEDLRYIFRWVYAHLKPGGLFIFDINSSYKLRNVIGDNTFTYNEEDLSYIWDNYLADEDTVEFYITFFVREGELYKKFDELHIEKIYETGEIVSMLKDSGFLEVDTNEAFTFDNVTEITERINFTAIKKGYPKELEEM